MLKDYHTDLHIHTCLSPCSDWEMSPRKIIHRSKEAGLDLIAICDHNSTENSAAAIRAGQNQGVCVLPGMEICSKEEVHILAIFSDLEPALAMQEFVYAHLPGDNRPDVFGYQVIADENDDVIDENPRLLIGASTLALKDIVAKTHANGGLSISSHVDRPGYGLIGQLGFIPEDLDVDGLEVSHRVPLADAKKTIPEMNRFACVTSSDAHYLNDIGKVRTIFHLAAPTLEEISLALAGKEGRRIVT